MSYWRYSLALLVFLAACGSESPISPVAPPQGVRYDEATVPTDTTSTPCPPDEVCTQSIYAVGTG